MKTRKLKIYNRVQELRQERQMTRVKLAEIVGCTTSHIKGIERGRWSVSQDIAEKIAEALGYRVGYIFTTESTVSEE